MHRVMILLCICSALCTLAADTVADPSAPSVFDLSLDELMESVVVTAQKRSEDPLTVPISMTVVSDKVIPRLAADRMLEMEYLVPNFNQGRGMSSSRGEISIRGIHDFSRNIGYDPRAGVYLDGAYLGRSYTFNQDLLELTRIEILRGPQGTLYGKNTISGAVNLVTAKPQADWGADVSHTVGNLGLAKSSGVINAPLFAGRLLVRAAVSGIDRDGFIHNTFLNTDLNGRDSMTARLRLLFQPVDGLEVNLSLDHFREDIASIDTIALDGSNPWVVSHDTEEFEEREMDGINLTTTYDFNPSSKIQYIGSYRESNWEEANEEDYTHLAVAQSDINETSHHQSHELRLHHHFGERGDLVVGLYHLDQEMATTRTGSFGAAGPVPNSLVAIPGQIGMRSSALFVHANYSLTSTLILTGGLRHTHERKRIRHTVMDSTGLFLDTHFEDQESWDATSPKLGINYSPSANQLFYLTLARAYKSGGWNAEFISDPIQLEQLQFEQESADSFELGWKARLWNEQLHINTAVFLMDFDDFQVFQFQQPVPGTTVLTFSNAGEVRTLGAELDIQARPLPNLIIGANMGLADAVFEEFKNGGGPGIDFDDNHLPFAPRQTKGLTVDYECPLPGQGAVVLRAEYSHTDSFYTNPNNSERYFVPDYESYNAWLTYTPPGGRWSFSAFGRNLADKVNMRSRDESFLGIVRASYNEPRTYGLTCRYRY